MTQSRPQAPAGFKHCCACKQILPTSLFNKHNQQPDGLQSRCKSCLKEQRIGYARAKGVEPRVYDRETLFWEKVNRTDDDACWEWTGYRNELGYGRFGIGGGDTTGAHRYSWTLHNRQPVPDGMYVMHSCDNPPCVNPAHLKIGTPLENSREMFDRGRAKKATGPRNFYYGRGDLLSGERNPNSKLTNAQRNELVDKYIAGGVRQVDLAAEYGITQVQVSRIIRDSTIRIRIERSHL